MCEFKQNVREIKDKLNETNKLMASVREAQLRIALALKGGVEK